jgi:cation:H+ antiporter
VIHFVLLIVCAVAIYLSCEWFVNAVEWLGVRLNVGKMAVGTILAAFGTALPEYVVTLVAVTTGSTEEAKNIGVGAAMGGPLALAKTSTQPDNANGDGERNARAGRGAPCLLTV